MSAKPEEVVAFIQERCLWQFFSRSWDREENIQGIIDLLGKIVKGEHISLETPADRCFYADAKILAGQLEERCPWISQISADSLDETLETVKARITEIAVTKSQNAELHTANY
jgi:V-containing nitrogenase delta subunit